MIVNKFKISVVMSLSLLMISTVLCFDCRAEAVTFRDTGQSLLLANSFYEVSFSRTNGSITSIKNTQSGAVVCYGSLNNSLWALDFFDPGKKAESSEYQPAGQKRFSYQWNAATDTLKFNYSGIPNATGQIDADVIIKASTENWFEMRLHVKNRYGSIIRLAYFPNDLAFSISEIEEALYPALPGTIFKKSFFQQGRSYIGRYPGWPGLFADLVSFKTVNGNLSIYMYQNTSNFIPSVFGFLAGEATADQFHYNHMIAAGTWDGGEYTSPFVKIRVREDYTESIEAYRLDNGYNSYPSLQQKLGALYEKVVQSPILKLETTKLKLRFDEYDSAVFDLMPSPIIYHFCGFQAGGFDENGPDLLPPESVWGTTENLASMVDGLHARGDLFMPYMNPTWWDDESPTMNNLPSYLNLKDIAVLHEGYVPVYETYNNYYSGYVMSPYSPFVKAVTAEKISQFTDLVESDIIFEDQIGARQWWFDFNSNSPALVSYIDGWIDHTREFKTKLLATELGFDRLAETEIAFYGSMLLPLREGSLSSNWGTDNLSFYPMASMLMRDKVMFYQHDLADYTMTLFKENFSWNLAFGYFPTMQIVSRTQMSVQWMRLLSRFSKDVLSKYASERVHDFIYLTDTLSKTGFETFEVFNNWDENYPCTVDAYSIAPSGAMVRSKAGDITGGFFTSFNGETFDGGEQCIIEERNSDSISIRHLLGDSTNISVTPLANWNTTGKFKIMMTLPGGAHFRVPYTIENGKIKFHLRAELKQQRVEDYLIIRDNTD